MIPRNLLQFAAMAEGTHSRTLTIETGVYCNNRCVFCYQQGYRADPDVPRMLPGGDVLERMRWGLANGHDELALTGGEPTIRPDFLDLVRQARALGYRRVAITTNGWMLADPGRFRAALEAGLTSLGVSIHGPSADIHDALTGHDGSFAHAVRTIRNAVRARAAGHLREVNTFTVVNRLNAERIVELADLVRALGVELLVLQPPILSKSNCADVASVRLPLASLADAVRRVALRGAEVGFRVKLFNLPPCMVREAFAGLQLDAYQRTTIREQDGHGPGAQAEGAVEPHMVRLSACAECVLRPVCPGLHVTLVPQEALAEHLEARIDAAATARRGELWLAGTDLLEAGTLGRVVRHARAGGARTVRVLSGGSGLSGRAGFEAAREAGAAEIVLVHHPAEGGSIDRIVSRRGNSGAVLRDVEAWAALAPGTDLGLGLLVGAGPGALDFLASEPLRAVAARVGRIYVRSIGSGASQAEDLPDVRAFLAGARRLGYLGADVLVELPWGPLEPDDYRFLRGVDPSPGVSFPRFDLGRLIVPTPLLRQRYSVLDWSVPGRLRGPAAGEGGLVIPIADATPIRSPSELESARRPGGDRPAPRGGPSPTRGGHRPNPGEGP
jgi:pyruvate-formate lyase-activating enzyme